MPTRYTDIQLAQHVHDIIHSVYDSPLGIKNAFRGKLNAVAKSLVKRQLIASELDELTEKIAADIYKHLNNITLMYIERRMSTAIKEENQYSGIDLSAYEADFRDLAKTVVGDLIKQRVKQVKDDAKSMSAKPKATPKRITPKKPTKR
jgi:hypothetical protein